MPTVFFCSPTNSTFFTTCCQCAIGEDEDKCPACKQEVFPKDRRSRWDKAMGKTK